MPNRKSLRGSPKSNQIEGAFQRIQELELQISQVIREMQEKVRQLECLNDFSSLMNSTLDLEEVRKTALEAVCKLVGCEGAILYIFDKKRGELYRESQDYHRLVFPIDDRSIAGKVAMTGEGVIENQIQAEPKPLEAFTEEMGIAVKSMICLPLKVKDQIIGILQAINKLPASPLRPSRHTWPDFHDQDKRLLETLSHSISSALENSGLYAQIKKNFFETVEALAEAIEKKDHYTGGHTKRVVYYAMCIVKYLSNSLAHPSAHTPALTPDEVEKIRLGAILHDVGKIGIEDKILKKSAPLDPDEWSVMQNHPQLGYEILRRVEGLKDVIGGMRYHHERWDGKGYPFGLKGEEIPLLARVISVADAYDAMVSTRPYRKGMDPKAAFDEILKNRGSQFDPSVVDAFIQAFQHEKMGKGSGGSHFGEDSGSVLLSNCD